MADLRALLEMRQAVPLAFSPDGARLLVGSNVPGTQQARTEGYAEDK